MHEAERDLAAQQIENAQVTDSYVIGDIDEDRVEELEQAGLVVDEVAPAGGPRPQRWREAPGRPTGATTGGSLGRKRDTVPGARGADAVAGNLASPLMGEMRQTIAATGAQLDEYVPNHAYVATATPEQAAEVINSRSFATSNATDHPRPDQLHLPLAKTSEALPPRHEHGIGGSPMRPCALRSYLA
jgi:hypothetical protein